MVTYAIKAVPKGAWDTHFHIFDASKFPYAEGRHFTPGTATLEELKTFESSIGVEYVCIAHGLAHGPDCSSLLHYLSKFDGKGRGICVIDVETVTDELLDKYHAAGVRSVRLDFFKAKAMDNLEMQVLMIEAMAARLVKWGGTGWSIQAQQPHLDFWPTLKEIARKLPLPLVIDHMGLLKGRTMHADIEVMEKSEFEDLLEALKDGNLWMKISAPYRNSRDEHEYKDLKEMVQAMAKANPKRVVWGSDWPHTQRHEDRHGRDPSKEEPFLEIDNVAWIESLSTWLSEEEWQALWVENPRTLYNFQNLDI